MNWKLQISNKVRHGERTFPVPANVRVLFGYVSQWKLGVNSYEIGIKIRYNGKHQNYEMTDDEQN